MSLLQNQSRLTVYSRLLLLLNVLLIGWGIYHSLIMSGGLLGWDQAAHSIVGSVMAYDMSQGDWFGLLYDMYRQVYWPPVHPFLLGLAFTVGGFSSVIARSLSLAMFIVAAVLIYLCGWQLARQRKSSVAFITTWLFLTSPALIPFAGDVMLEMTALVFLNLSLYLFIKIDTDSPTWMYTLVGLAIDGAYFTKSNYGLLLIIVLAIELLIESHLRPRMLLSRPNLYIWLPIIITSLIWFAYPPKIQQTLRAIVNVPFGAADRFSLEGLLYYPRALVAISGGTFFFILFAAAVTVALFKYRERNLRFLVLLVLVQLLIGELHQTKVIRHLFPVLPALFLLTAYILVHQTFDTMIKGRQVRLMNLLAVAALIYSQGLAASVLQPVSTRQNRMVLDYISEIIRDEKPTLILGSIDLKNPVPPLLDWHLISDNGLMLAIHSDLGMNYEGDKRIVAVAKRIYMPTSLANRLGLTTTRIERSGIVRSLYVGIDASSYSQEPEALLSFLQDWQQKNLFSRVILVTPHDMNRAWAPIGRSPYPLDYFTSSLAQLDMKPVISQVFQQENTRIDVYE